MGWQKTPWGRFYTDTSVNPFEIGKNTFMCRACKTTWKSYKNDIDVCPFCGKKYTVIKTV